MAVNFFQEMKAQTLCHSGECNDKKAEYPVCQRLWENGGQFYSRNECSSVPSRGFGAFQGNDGGNSRSMCYYRDVCTPERTKFDTHLINP